MMSLRILIASTLGLLATVVTAQLPTSGIYAAAPDAWLLGSGREWHLRTAVSDMPRKLVFRDPTAAESQVVEKAKLLFQKSSAKSMALFQGTDVVWLGYKEPATADTRFLSLSVGKTVTSMAIGKSICGRKMAFDSLVGKMLPELAETDLGKATVGDLLKMSSGTWEGNPDSTIVTSRQDEQIVEGRQSFFDLLRTAKVSTAHEDPSGAKRKPGQEFAYRSTDPLALGVLINMATGMHYAEWVEQQVLLPAGIARPAVIGQDRYGFGQADGNVRMYLEDWIRFAVWVKESEAGRGCFADYLHEATRTQVANRTKRFGKLFDGYGYLIWTENRYLRDSYWAVGHGGQRIGWNHGNNRMLVAFSNAEDYMDDLYRLYREWASLSD